MNKILEARWSHDFATSNMYKSVQVIFLGLNYLNWKTGIINSIFLMQLL